MKKTAFRDDENGREWEVFVLEQTTVGGRMYLLVTEDEDDDSTAYILRQKEDAGEDAVYEMVGDETEARAVSKVFAEILEDVEIV